MADDQTKAPTTTAPKTKRYTVLSPVSHNKKSYEPGDTLALSDEHAAPLVAVRAIEEAK